MDYSCIPCIALKHFIPMSVQYETTVDWDLTLRDVEYVDTDTMGAAFAGLVVRAVKVTTGAPAATIGKFLRGAIIVNAFDGIVYINAGTTASPVWEAIEAGTISLANGQILIGNGSGVATGRTPSGDWTISNTGVAILREDLAMTATVVLSSLDILQLFNFPITLIQAPGAGKVVIVDQIVGLNNFNAAAFAGGNAMEFRYNNTAGILISQLSSAFINSVADRIDQAAVGGFQALLASNQPVIVWVPVADPTLGDGAITLQIRYRIVTSPF